MNFDGAANLDVFHVWSNQELCVVIFQIHASVQLKQETTIDAIISVKVIHIQIWLRMWYHGLNIENDCRADYC